jgi:RNA polymerase sigma factor (sigma-70 family)
MFSNRPRSSGVRKLHAVPAPSEPPHTDRGEWEQLIRAHDRRVFLSVLALGVRPDRARDVVQMTWTRLIEKDRRGEITMDNIGALAVAQARFLALDELRRASDERKREAAMPDLRNEIDVERLILGRERLERAVVALQGCPPAAQQLFKLLYAEPPMSYTRAAAELGLSLQRVRQLMCELRKRLRVAIEEGET